MNDVQRSGEAAQGPTMELRDAQSGFPENVGAPSVLPDVSIDERAEAHLPGPIQRPPTEEAIEAGEEGISAWYNDKKISALWSDRANRNSWIAIAGMGWKKLSNASETAVVSMTMLAAHAEQTNSTVNVRIESDGTVHEIYVW